MNIAIHKKQENLENQLLDKVIDRIIKRMMWEFYFVFEISTMIQTAD